MDYGAMIPAQFPPNQTFDLVFAAMTMDITKAICLIIACLLAFQLGREVFALWRIKCRQTRHFCRDMLVLLRNDFSSTSLIFTNLEIALMDSYLPIAQHTAEAVAMFSGNSIPYNNQSHGEIRQSIKVVMPRHLWFMLQSARMLRDQLRDMLGEAKEEHMLSTYYTGILKTRLSNFRTQVAFIQAECIRLNVGDEEDRANRVDFHQEAPAVWGAPAV